MTPVSLIIATWNRAKSLQRVLKSIYDQHYPALEVIIVDNGSTDDTKSICGQYPVRYYYNHKDGWGGAGPSVNAGIKLATHDLIILQSADIEHQQPDTIARMVAMVEQNDKLWIMCHVDAQISEDSTATRLLCSANHREFNAFYLSILWKKWLLEVHGFDEDYTMGWGEDGDLAGRLIRHCGLQQVFTDDIRGLHLWHISQYRETESIKQCYYHKCRQMDKGEITCIRNLDRDWGQLRSDNRAI